MPIVDSTELAQIQGDFEALLDKTVTIRRVTHTSDGAGGWSDSASTSTTNGMIYAGSGSRAQAIASRLGIEVVWTVALPHDADVQADDELIIDGTTYKVHAPITGHSYTALQVLVCSEVISE